MCKGKGKIDMQIAHSKSGMRMLFSKDEHKILSNNQKQDYLWIEINSKSNERFLALSPKEFPNSSSVKFYEARSSSFPFFTNVTGKKWIGLKDLPHFSPEPVILNPHNTHDGVLFFAPKPPMERAPNAGKRITPIKKKKVISGPGDKISTLALNSGGLPKVESKPEDISEEVRIMTLRQAIDVINQAKDGYEGAMKLEITPSGRLVMMMIYGGD